nr:isoamylase 2, chloroplastic [Ipomoea batatas]
MWMQYRNHSTGMAENFTQKISSKPYGLMVVAATAADTSVIQTAGQVSKYLFRTETTGLVKVSVDKRNSKYGVQIQVLPSELDGRVGELVMIWGLFRSDAQSLMSLDSQSVGTSNKQSTVETVFQSKSSGKLVELDFELSLAPFYLSFFLKSELASEVNNSEIKSHRKTNFVVPIGFSSGHPAPLGLSFLSDGSVNFAVLSRSSESVVLCLYDDLRKEKPVIELDLDPYVNRSGDVWHASIDGSLPFVGYGYRCKGATAEKTEHALLDPYAKILVDYIPPREGFNLVPSNFTKDKSSKLPAQVAGTFSGITEKLQHFKDLGVNAILLEPIFPFDEQKGPYFPVHFFSPGHLCGPPGDPSSIINSMKQMVKEVHVNGIEVFLQVVFTHTAEGASLLHIDKSSYYYLEDDMGMKSGNSLNCNYPPVQQMILDSLRHWVVEYHIDGFCFVNASFLTRGFHGEFLTHPPLIEAIAFDPLLAKVKLIADFWDPVENTNFLRGNGSLSKLATRLCGSGDVFSGGRGPAFSLNYIARNFGLPLVDLVSFSSREVASELSWNCGEEGPTNKNAVLERRLKQIRNFLFILFISLGVPVLNMGDECGRSSGGSPAYEDRKPFDWNALRTDTGEIESSTASDLPGHLFAAFNSADHSESVVLPPLPAGMAWYRLVDTALPFPGFFSEKGTPIEDGSATYEMKSHSCMLLEAKHTNG